jgi:hypothetical protein
MHTTTGARDAKEELTATIQILCKTNRDFTSFVFYFTFFYFFVPQHFEHFLKLKKLFCG